MYEISVVQDEEQEFYLKHSDCKYNTLETHWKIMLYLKTKQNISS